MIKKLFLIVLLLFALFACSIYKQDGSKLFESVKDKNYREIDEFVKKGGNINIKDEKGETVLWSAIRSNDVEMVRYLISKGADINADCGTGAEE
ncbi:MAG TPA: ankyrin repeat domain-containing protein [bacterium]|nr:ankyrin repeat domain-containing protein [bacterium]